jgi:transglutaminase-like putative cysteine protease
MEFGAVPIDDQPIAASFFGEGKWLSDYITPEQPDIQTLYADITRGYTSVEDKAVACWNWVANKVRYKPFVTASINVDGKSSYQGDYWQTPSMCLRTKVGNCANKAFLLTSLLRNEVPETQIYCVLGNLYNGRASGHSWVEITLNGKDYVLEATRNDVPMVESTLVDRYEPVHYFNDKIVMGVPGRTVMQPFHASYSTWLRDYLQWSYINGRK